MNKDNSVGQNGPVEIIAEWEGPANPAPGVLFEERQAQHLAAASDVAELVSWIAVTAFSGVLGNSIYDLMRNKVVGVLSAWRRRFGQAKIDEVQKRLFDEMQKYRTNGKKTEAELREDIRRLFDQIQV